MRTSSIRPRLLTLCLLLPLVGSTLAQDLPYTIDASQPREIARKDGEETFAFGPVRMTFPSGWSFQRAGNLTKGSDGQGGVAFVSVLIATEATLRKGLLTAERMAAAKARAAAETKDACATLAEPTVEAIRGDALAVVFASGCEEESRKGLGYAVRYDIYSTKGVVQLMFAGSGSQANARATLDKVATSHAW